jgi:RNA polymerase sigma-70 factor (ECF subfamily)
MSDTKFKTLLIALIPQLRGFARGIARQPDADDLAQEALLRGWRARASYQPGTNFKAWMFTILRNEHCSRARRAWRTQPLDPEVAENTLVSNDNPVALEELLDVRNAMQELTIEHRQALTLVGAAGLSYLETAAICGCPVGTIKSRVNRARIELAAILQRRQLSPRMKTSVSASQAFDAIMAEASNLQRLRPSAA